MTKRYPNLLSPFKIGNVIFKNRLTASPTHSHFTQGTEPYPTEAMITFYANRAKNGAALVTCTHFHVEHIVTTKFPQFVDKGYARHQIVTETGKPAFLESNLENYLSQMTETIHFYGSKASMAIQPVVPFRYDVSTGHVVLPGIKEPVVCEEISIDMLNDIAEDYALQAALMKDLGFDMAYLHMAYRGPLLARFLSPLTNKRTDQFGGSLENRARFPLMVADRIKQKCGRDFLIEACISGSEPPGGYTLGDTVEYAKLFAGHFDLLQLRAGDGEAAHPTGFNTERTPFLHMSEAVKKSGADIAMVTIGGYLDPGICENVIASNKADFIAMARAWISNNDLGRKLYEGRGEDVVPCLRCNKCHLSNYMNPWARVCSVNPVWGFEHKIERMIEPPIRKKKVAVVGGGPAGMEAALVASGRGHHITLYEKSNTLGGLMNTANNVSFKWPLKSFKNYLVHKIERTSNIKVRLNTEAIPDMLKKENYDVVLYAVGSEPIVPDIPGINGKNVVFAKDVYGNEDMLMDNVVVIGGGETGVETGMHLAGNGHKVTVLEMGDMLVPKTAPIMFYEQFKTAWEKLENFKSILQVRCNGIGNDRVTYIDIEGMEHEIAAGSVVIAVGSQPKNSLVLEFYDAVEQFFVIGDCAKVGDIQKTMRSAFSIASMV